MARGAMKRYLFIVTSFLACQNVPRATTNQPAPPTAAKADAPAATAEECTLHTPLVPGVPGSPGHLIPSAQNPNGQSELAALMRSMQAELKAARVAIPRGQKVGPFLPRFRKIRCAWPTTPDDRNAQFDDFARAYLDAVAELDRASAADAASAYTRVLHACRTCHEHSCSGAIVAIDALQLTPASAAPPASPPSSTHCE